MRHKASRNEMHFESKKSERKCKKNGLKSSHFEWHCPSTRNSLNFFDFKRKFSSFVKKLMDSARDSRVNYGRAASMADASAWLGFSNYGRATRQLRISRVNFTTTIQTRKNKSRKLLFYGNYENSTSNQRFSHKIMGKNDEQRRKNRGKMGIWYTCFRARIVYARTSINTQPFAATAQYPITAGSLIV